MMTRNAELTRQSTLFAGQQLDGEAQREDIDFKMVTFSLGGKEYGVDIMKVKEIAKFEGFTYVPNTQPFVSGVYNLRGDIISVIDLRIMFNLPAPQLRAGQPRDGLILRLDHGLIGVVVDSIDRVVGISSETIQPPHPIFADVNIKYISGVVEHDERLYIILDVERILGEGEEEEAREIAAPAESAGPARQPVQSGAQTAEMVAQTLQTLSGFTLTELNRAWVEQRLREWESQHGGSAQITTQEEVDEFLATFYSPYTGRFWERDYLEGIASLLPDSLGNTITVWNPGCGQGYESYSIAALLRSRYPNARIKVWAGDNDLLSVSNAPNLVFDRRAVPDFYEPYLLEGSNGLSFNADIRQAIVFEFADVTHTTTMPACDVVIVRDLLSFLTERDLQRVVAMIDDYAKDGALVIPGAHEDLLGVGDFQEVSTGALRAFRTK